MASQVERMGPNILSSASAQRLGMMWDEWTLPGNKVKVGVSICSTLGLDDKNTDNY